VNNKKPMPTTWYKNPLYYMPLSIIAGYVATKILIYAVSWAITCSYSSDGSSSAFVTLYLWLLIAIGVSMLPVALLSFRKILATRIPLERVCYAIYILSAVYVGYGAIYAGLITGAFF